MDRKRIVIRAAVVLALVNIVLRGAGVSFNTYTAQKIGGEGMGLYTLVMSVYGFAVTLATSSVNLAAVRLTAERCAQIEGADRESHRRTVREILRAVCGYGLLFGCGAGLLLLLGARWIAYTLLGDGRTLASLRILAFSLPPIALTSALAGYFTGMQRVGKNALVAVLEQGIKILVTVTALAIVPADSPVETMCGILAGAATAAEIWSMGVAWILYRIDSGIPQGDTPGTERKVRTTTFSDAAEIALPTAVGAYARQGFVTAEHLAIPWGLKRSGSAPGVVLASYGILQGVVFPVILFPYAVVGAFTGVLIPEIAACRARGEYTVLRGLVRRVLRGTVVFALLCFAVFFGFSDALGQGICGNGEAAGYIRILSFLVPFMYLDTVTDAILKGLGEQVYCMKVNIADAGCSFLLVLLLTPRMGLYGYICTLFVCEIVNLGCSLWKLWDCMEKTEPPRPAPLEKEKTDRKTAPCRR